MRYATFPVALLALALLMVVPVGGAPNLQVGSTATYNLSVRVSFTPPLCETTTATSVQPDVIACPLDALSLPIVVVNGTIAWTTTGLNSSTAVLNVTRDLTTYFGNHTFTNIGSFSESIFLANRTISLKPIIMPDMDQALQLAQNDLATAVPSVSNWTSSMNIISSVIWTRPSIYTMWWVNGPLKLNDTVGVLRFPTNVTSSSTIDLGGSLGSPSAWNLTYTLPSFEDPAMADAIPIGDNFHTFLSFNYDQQSDLLLSATADTHFGFVAPLAYQTNGCVPSATTKCPYGSNCVSIINSGINIQASLTLAKTNLNLNQRLGAGENGSGLGTDSSSGTGSGTTGSTGGTSSGGNSGSTSGGSSSGGNSGGSSSGGTNSGSTGSSNPVNNGGNGAVANGGSNPGGASPSTPKPQTSFPWIYVILAAIAVVIVASGTYYARRRSAKSKPQTSIPQTAT